MRSVKSYFYRKEKAAFILCCLFLLSVPLYAQQPRLYDGRRLIADSTLELTPAAYKIWNQVEDSIINKIESVLQYPRPFIENCITPNTIILSFTYTAGKAPQLRIEKALNTGGWDNEIIKNIARAHIEQYFENTGLKKNKAYRFYIPLKWKIKDTQPCIEYWQQTKDRQPLTTYELMPVNTIKTVDNGWIYLETNIKLQVTSSYN